MSIYIPNIEIPKEDRLTLQISADGAVYVVNKCNITAETYTTNVIPIPPHGRLIDADALEEAGSDVHEDIVCCGYVEYSIWGFSHDMIREAPTIIPAEGGK